MSLQPDSQRFRVKLTADFFIEDRPRYAAIDFGILEDQQHIEVAWFEQHHQVITPEQIGEASGVMVLSPAVTRESVSNSENLLAIGRFGVGYDLVDIKACTDSDVLVFITAGAVDRSMAEAIVTWMLALSHHVRMKDQLVRTGEWDRKAGLMGRELRDRTLGVVGLGGIGKALVKLLNGFGMNRPCAFDPYIDPGIAREAGVEIVDLDALLTASDFVAICCPLNEETRGLIGGREIGLMKPEAYLINAARGGIVVEDALFEALQNRRIAGAGIDVFENEPVTRPPRFASLDNVVLAPHSIGWTDELFRDIWRALCYGMINLSFGKRPVGVVNPEVLDKPGFQAKWKRLSTAR